MASSSILSTASRLQGKVALITGGAKGIGEATARIFVNHGAKIVLADIDDDLGHSVSRSIGRASCKYVHCDVTDESQVRNAVDKALEAHGKLDIMVNNAAILGRKEVPIADNDKANFEHVMGVNVTGVFLGMKHAARAMIPRKSGGSIITMGSIVSSIGGVCQHAYTCSKHAVIGLTVNAAVELGQFGIRVNCVSPYALATPATRDIFGLNDSGIESKANSLGNLKGVTLNAEDVANAALFLASDEGRYVSGHNLLVDGGFTIVNPSFGIFNYSKDEI